MYYDYNQLVKDLRQITSAFGQPVQHGFYTISVYKRDGLEIRDDLNEVTVTENGQKIDLDFLPMKNSIAEKLLKLAIRADEHYGIV